MDRIIKDIQRENGEVLRVAMGEYRGKTLLNVRIWYTDAESGELRPTKKGITVSESQYAEFIEAVGSCAESFNP